MRSLGPALAITRAAAPAERAPGRRGWRGWLACGLAIAAVAVLWTSLGSGGSGELAVRGQTFRYRLDGPPELDWWKAGASLALLGASLLLWTARRRAMIVVGVLLAAGGLAVGAHTFVLRYGSHALSQAALTATRLGATRGEVLDRLGTPSGTATLTDRARGGTLDCLVYRVRQPDPVTGRDLAMLCLSGDRLAVRTTG